MPSAITLDPLNVGDVHRLRFVVKKNSSAWDLSGIGAGVTIKMRRPDATLLSFGMTAEDAAHGVFYYDTTTSDLDQAGTWSLGLVIDDGAGVVKTYAGDISLEVGDRPNSF